MTGLEISHMRSTSPTLAEVMRVCELRAALSKTPGISDFVLGNPKAWLGTAYHAVLEKIVDVDLGSETLDTAIERLWDQAVAAQDQRNHCHLLDRRFGPPVRWPGYHLARASVFLRAREPLGRQEKAHVGRERGGPERSGVAACEREREFTAFGGKLVGRPDVVRSGVVIDYKSGSILEYDERIQTEVVKAAYVRQLHIYGYLVKESLGSCPHRGLLLPVVGDCVEVALDAAHCEEEAREAVSLLDMYNGKIAARALPGAFASPSPEACKWCPFKLVCPPFWQRVSPTWSGQLDGAAVEGTVNEAPHSIHGGAAIALSVSVHAGSEAPGQFQIAPLTPAIHTAVTTVGAGERVRLIGLRIRPDAALVPTQRTVLARIADLPAVTVKGNA